MSIFIFEPPFNEAADIGSTDRRFDNIFTKTLHADSLNIDGVDLSGIFDGDYDNLINKPDLSAYASDTHNHSLSELSEKSYNSLTNKPDLSLKADLVGGLVPSAQLPTYVDDVLEYTNFAGFPVTGETGKIYIDITESRTYRWSGTVYVNIGQGVLLGETSTTAYAGNLGQTAYTHSQSAHAPVNAQANADITKAEIEAKLTGTIDTHTHASGIHDNKTVLDKFSESNGELAYDGAIIRAEGQLNVTSADGKVYYSFKPIEQL